MAIFLRGKSSILQKPWHGRPAVCSQPSSTLDPLYAFREEMRIKHTSRCPSPPASIVLKVRWLPSSTKDLRIHASATPHLQRIGAEKLSSATCPRTLRQLEAAKAPPALGSPCPARHLLNSPYLPTNCLCFTAKPCYRLGRVIVPPPPFYKGGETEKQRSTNEERRFRSKLSPWYSTTASHSRTPGGS